MTDAKLARPEWLKVGRVYVRPEEIAAVVEGDQFNAPRVFLRGNSTEFSLGQPGEDMADLLKALGATGFRGVQ